VLYGVHVALAVVFVAGIAAAAVFNVQALRAARPSQVARAFLRVRPLAFLVTLVLLAQLVTGLVLVRHRSYGYGAPWVVASIVLWVVANALGGIGGKRDRETRELAERLTAEGDRPSEELRTRVRDPKSLALSYGGGLAGIAILILMLTRPG
jgi:uncharacterized membrane protein